MSLVEIDWNPDAKALRRFGVTMLIGFGLIGILFRLGVWPLGGLGSFPLGAPHPGAARVCWIVGVVAGLAGVSGTSLALPVYRAWMGVAFVIGNVVSRVLVAALFYGLITPMGLVMRLRGRDKLMLRKPKGDTFWRPVEMHDDPARYERQF